MPDPGDQGNRRRDEEGLSNLALAYRRAGPYLSAGFTLAAAIGGLGWLGHYFDERLGHKTPWLFLVGVAVGMVGGFVSFFKTVLGAGKKP